MLITTSLIDYIKGAVTYDYRTAIHDPPRSVYVQYSFKLSSWDDSACTVYLIHPSPS